METLNAQVQQLTRPSGCATAGAAALGEAIKSSKSAATGAVPGSGDPGQPLAGARREQAWIWLATDENAARARAKAGVCGPRTAGNEPVAVRKAVT